MDKQRFILAIILSAAILLGWSVLFKGTPPPQPETPATNTPSPSQTATPVDQQGGTSAEKKQGPSFELPNDPVSPKSITIVTPLYKVVLDNRGAVASSWIITKNRESGAPLYSVMKKQPVELELIPQDLAKTGEAPLRVRLSDVENSVGIDEIFNARRYEVSEVIENAPSVTLQNEQVLEVQSGTSKTLEFRIQLEHGADEKKIKLDGKKTITFFADDYNADIRVDYRVNDVAKPAALLIGPNIGDQAIEEHNFYSVAPEGIAAVGDDVRRDSSIEINHARADQSKIQGAIDWAGVGDTYFAMIVVPSSKTDGLEYRTRMVERPIDVDGQKRALPNYLITAYVPMPSNNGFARLYVGPKDHYLLQSASESVGRAVGRPELDLEGLIDYGFLSWMSRPLAVPILWCIKFLHKVTGSYGIAIILFTIVIYSLFFPLKWRSSKAMKRAQKLAPRMKELQEKIKGMKKTDPRLRELQMEQMRLMKEGNPLGGCLPLLIQMPFLFALYRAITISIDFRHASFLWIPDLSAAEPTMIHVLPVLMAGSMMVLQLITPAPSADPMQRKMMAIGMPLLMLWMLWSAPAGLLLYWLVGNLVGFGQQFLINHLTRTEDDQPPPSGKKAETRSTKKLKARVSQA